MTRPEFDYIRCVSVAVTAFVGLIQLFRVVFRWLRFKRNKRPNTAHTTGAKD